MYVLGYLKIILVFVLFLKLNLIIWNCFKKNLNWFDRCSNHIWNDNLLFKYRCEPLTVVGVVIKNMTYLAYIDHWQYLSHQWKAQENVFLKRSVTKSIFTLQQERLDSMGKSHSCSESLHRVYVIHKSHLNLEESGCTLVHGKIFHYL